jgi:hypothetical protein
MKKQSGGGPCCGVCRSWCEGNADGGVLGGLATLDPGSFSAVGRDLASSSTRFNLAHWECPLALRPQSRIRCQARIVDANGEQELFEATRRQLPASALYVNGYNSAVSVLNVAAIVLEARLATDGRSAVELWRKAVAAQDALNYDEPPPWYYPIRESLGGALLRNGQAVEAEAVFREDLRRDRRNGRCLFGLMESLKAQNKLVDAEWVRKQYQASWRGAPLSIADL